MPGPSRARSRPRSASTSTCPSISQPRLSSALAINPNTVLRAYRELEHRGLAEGRPGQGTFICGTLRRAGLAEQEALRSSLLGWLHSADEAGQAARRRRRSGRVA